MRVLALPRDAANPVQELLYGPMRSRGIRVAYLGDLTRSRTLNVALLPLELVARRLTGWRIVHLHWVFAFAVPGGTRAGRLASTASFRLFLALVRALGMRLVWTAHNTLPHAPVLADDLAERRRLVRSADLVIAHSDAALADLVRRVGRPRRAVMIPHGAYAAEPAANGAARGGGGGPRRVLFFGNVHRYKGVEELLAARAALGADVDLAVTVAGECRDAALRERLRSLAGERVTLRLERVPDPEVGPLMAAADVVALPYRAGTTSGALALALSHGRPVIVPDLAAFDEVPGDAALRYDGSLDGLVASMRELAEMDGARLGRMSAAAREHRVPGWDEIADRTAREMRAVLDGGRA